MDHLKKYNEFSVNEGFWTSDFDKTLEVFYKRVRDIFDSNSLTWDPHERIFTYILEETDSPTGFIKISVENMGGNRGFKYKFVVDGEEIECSNLMKRKFYRFFLNKISGDKPLKELFRKISNSFDIDILTWDPHERVFVYVLNERDKQTRLYVENMGSDRGYKYKLLINGEEIECSSVLKREIYRFFVKRWKERDKARLKKKAKDFAKKYRLE